jgi:hypothetical protein
MTSDPVHMQPLSADGRASWPSRSSLVGTIDGRIFNPTLIVAGVIYAAWSWVHLPSSIWVRSLFACYLIWRMKPDVIIPFVLSCVQLRIQIGGRGSFDDVQDLSMQMTGYEQYAFILPCMLYAVRTFFAALSVRVARRSQFPFWLYNLYLFGMLFVVVGAMSAYGKPGWTAGLRDYCVVGLYFYGLLMPECSKRQLMQLVTGFAFLGMLTVLANLLIGYQSRQLWVLLPIAGSFAPLVILGRGSLWHCCVAAAYSFAGAVFAVEATFTLVLLWVWNTIAGICLGPFGRKTLRWAVVTGLTYALLVMTLGMFFYAAVAHDPTRELYETVRGGQGSTYDRMTFKLLSDRGPIWWGAMRELSENPTWCGNPAPQFTIRSLNKEAIWPYSTHSILMDPLLRLGLVAGPILLLILVHTALLSRNAVARETDISVAVLGLAVISNIILGGATLPYMLNERAAEHIYMAAGLLGVYGLRRPAVRTRSPHASPQPVSTAPVLPAAALMHHDHPAVDGQACSAAANGEAAQA